MRGSGAGGWYWEVARLREYVSKTVVRSWMTLEFCVTIWFLLCDHLLEQGCCAVAAAGRLMGAGVVTFVLLCGGSLDVCE